MNNTCSEPVVVVTGAGSGIGAATALRLGGQGYQVVCADVSPDRSAEVAEKLIANGGRADAVPTDVTDGKQVQQLVGRTIGRFGRIDALINNAGVGSVGSAVEVDEAEWNRVLSTNLTGAWLCARAVLPHMTQARRGSIVNLSSITALHGYPRIAAYSAAKGGIIALTRQMARDVAEHGVRVNAVVPGTVHTPLTQGLWDGGGGFGGSAATVDEQVSAAGAGYPLGRLGTADEISSMIAFLTSDAAAWITGQVHVVDGGRTAIG
ncbi:SDR family oxidoreductase [Pseudonocardia kujensis]|uniref:SDR family NAD(P)-dependent oxidoreductase n=1 Tax=Pseudonocardia kujensis TaxID=1128675 RepID=UPI001E2A9C86|nr:SDR family NAD(P)-dependent oxidoreductase [Pseudonocardia kujensis]MCE0762100.1 SDR family oxidoreductase [Pseudonocardia kujensis]